MRFLTGLLFGILLTIGTAYVVDAIHSAPDDKTPQNMVNWSVVSSNLSGLSSGVQSAWTKLVGAAKQVDKSITEKPKT